MTGHRREEQEKRQLVVYCGIEKRVQPTTLVRNTLANWASVCLR